MFPDIFLDKLNLVLENRFSEFCHGAIECIDGYNIRGLELVADEILFETDVVADPTGEQCVVFDVWDICNGISTVTPSSDAAFRERRLVNGDEVGVHLVYLWRVVYASYWNILLFLGTIKYIVVAIR